MVCWGVKGYITIAFSAIFGGWNLRSAEFQAHTKERERGERGPGGKGGGLLRATSYHTRVSIIFIPMTKAGELLLRKPEEDESPGSEVGYFKWNVSVSRFSEPLSLRVTINSRSKVSQSYGIPYCVIAEVLIHI
jgi:hypothetical protein